MKKFINYQNRINEFLIRQLDTRKHCSSRLKDSMEYSLLSGGKRIRPLLVYATAQSIGLEFRQADYIAASIEMIHAYSLIHDDLPAMDNDDLRRGQPTNHIKFDEATAILAGDALQSLSFEVLSQLPASPIHVINLIRMLAQASGLNGMAGGQSLDLIYENQLTELDQLQLIHAAKTGALLKACISLTVELETTDQQDKQLFIQFADHLGIAFQIVDDILDVTQTTEILGKPANSDTKNNKSTYPGLLGLNHAQDIANQHISEAFSILNRIKTNTDMLCELTEIILKRSH